MSSNSTRPENMRISFSLKTLFILGVFLTSLSAMHNVYSVLAIYARQEVLFEARQGGFRQGFKQGVDTGKAAFHSSREAMARSIEARVRKELGKR